MSALTAAPLAAKDCEGMMKIATAEALHVDGRYEDAIKLWLELAKSDYCDWNVSVKTAASLISAGAYESAEYYLKKASQLNAPSPIVGYVRAQLALQQSRYKDAFVLLESSNQHNVESSDCFCLLGVLHARLQRRQEAVSWTNKALDLHPNHAPSLCNSVLLGTSVTPLTVLRKAAKLAPQRSEPLAIAAKRAPNTRKRLQNTLEEAADLRSSSGLARSYSSSNSYEAISASASCVFSTTTTINLAWRIPHNSTRPEDMSLREGYTVFNEQQKLINPQAKAGDKFFNYELDDSLWRQEPDSQVLRLTLKVESAAKALVVDGLSEIEIRDKWLPTPVPERPIHWAVTVNLPQWESVIAEEPCRRAPPALIAFNSPNRFAGPCTIALGHVRRIELAAMVSAVEAALPLWQEVMCDGWKPKPILAIVNQPHSTNCYTWDNVIRIPSGVAGNSKHLPILIHEVGHLWWGGRVRFDTDSLWLAEALAEYTLHLAGEVGLVEGYRQKTWQMLTKLCNTNGCTTCNLLDLSVSADSRDTYALRAAGGYMISALQKTLGPEVFAQWLKILTNQEHSINAYQAFALASQLNGHSLNYFVHQWVMSDTLPELVVHARVFSSDNENNIKLELCCELIGATLPIAELPIKVTLEDACMVDATCDLSLGASVVEITCSACPVQVEPDPDRLWLLYYHKIHLEFTDERFDNRNTVNSA